MENRLLLDLDGVVADTMGACFSLVNEQYETNIVHADVHDYWFKDLILPPDVFMDALRTKGFYRNLDVITGAVGAVNRLRNQYDVVVCSAPMQGAEFCEDEKREWLAEKFDSDFAEQAIITTDKSKVKGKAIIEDNPHIQGDFIPIMFDQAWNRNYKGHRMYGWHDLTAVKEVM